MRWHELWFSDVSEGFVWEQGYRSGLEGLRSPCYSILNSMGILAYSTLSVFLPLPLTTLRCFFDLIKTLQFHLLLSRMKFCSISRWMNFFYVDLSWKGHMNSYMQIKFFFARNIVEMYYMLQNVRQRVDHPSSKLRSASTGTYRGSSFWKMQVSILISTCGSPATFEHL